MAHFVRGQKLRLFDIDRRTGFRHRHHEIGLARQKGRQLDDIGDFSSRRCLPGLVHIGNDGHVIARLDIGQDLQAFFQPRPPVGVDRAAIRFVETGLEHIRHTQLLRHIHVGLRHFIGQLRRLQHVHAAKQHEWQRIAGG